MIDDNQQLQKYVKILIWFSAAAVLVVIIIWVVHFILMGTLTVKSDYPNASVSITPIQNGQLNNPAFKQAQHKLTERVSAGKYQLKATYKSFAVSEVISINSMQSLSFTLNPTVAVSPEPVYGGTVSDVVADSSQVMFIDNSNNNALSVINGSNNITTLYNTFPLYDAVWANTSLGLARDYTDNLFVIHNGQVSQLNSPFSGKTNPTFQYSIYQNGQIYVTGGKSIYEGSISGNFHKIYTSSGSIVGLSAGKGEVAAIESPGSDFEDPEGNLVVVSDSGKVRRTNISTTQVSFSPDNKYLGLINSSGAAIYNAASLDKIASLPSTSTNAFAWGRNDAFFYNQSSTLWDYSVSNNQSNNLEQTPQNSNILGISATPDGSYVYLDTASTNANANTGESQLFRVGLENQSPHSGLDGLSVFLPETLNAQGGYCKLNYVNFTSPTITIHYPGTQNPTTENGCLLAAKNEIQQYGLSPGDYSYSFYPDGQ